MTPFLPITREWLLEELLEDTRPTQPCIEEASTQVALKMLRLMVPCFVGPCSASDVMLGAMARCVDDCGLWWRRFVEIFT